MQQTDMTAQLVAYNQSYKENDEIYHSYAKAVGMTDTTFWLLYSLWEHREPYTQKELCEEWSYISQTLNSALKNLEKQGLIRMECGAGNRKNKKILFTEKGTAFAARVIEPLIQAERQSFECMSKEECEQFLEAMDRLNVALKREVDALIHDAVKDREAEQEVRYE